MKLEQVTLNKLKINPAIAKKLSKLHLTNALDLIFHLPRSFEDRITESFVQDLSDKSKGVFKLEVINSYSEFYNHKRLLKVNALDGQGTDVQINFLIFPNRTEWMINYFHPGKVVKVFGELLVNHNAFLRRSIYSLYHPEIIFDDKKIEKSECLTPIYPSTTGLAQNSIRLAINKALNLLPYLQDLSPQQGWPIINSEQGIIDLNQYTIAQALYYLHNPPRDTTAAELLTAKSPQLMRLIAEEILAVQCSMELEKEQLTQEPSISFPTPTELLNQAISLLKFKLTSAQLRVVNEIAFDLKRGKAMYRLVHGDVGSGKSIVAALAALIVCANGYQVVIMAPTDLLATQLASTVEQTISELGFKTALLTGKLNTKDKKLVVQAISNQQVDVICGTHALFSDGIEFPKLGMVIIDEQHKFGVDQRNKMIDKNKDLLVHQLMLSATPIPRTLAMVQYANMMLSKLDELPAGKLPIDTRMISQNRKDEVIGLLDRALKEKRQIYWIAALVEDSEKSDMISVNSSYDYLTAALPQAKIAVVHGKQKNQEKEQAMQFFAQGKADILLATTVVEVGINVPNSTVIIIDNAERYGLAQLHQLRGRVGRGKQQSYCILLYKENISEISAERLKILRQTNDGFEIAEADLLQRGFGDIFGIRQHGNLDFKFSDLVRDKDIVNALEGLAQNICKHQPDLALALVNRWQGSKLHFLKS